MGYQIEQVAALKKKLAAVPKARAKPVPLKTIDVLRLLHDDIESLRSKGHRLDAIAVILGQHGLHIASKTLRNYLSIIRLDPPQEVSKTPVATQPATPRPRESVSQPEPSKPAPPPDVPRAIKALPSNPNGAGGFVLYPDTEDI